MKQHRFGLGQCCSVDLWYSTQVINTNNFSLHHGEVS